MSAKKEGVVLPRFIQDVEADLSGAKVPRFNLSVIKKGGGQAAPPTNTDYVVITIPYKNGVPVYSHNPAGSMVYNR